MKWRGVNPRTPLAVSTRPRTLDQRRAKPAFTQVVPTLNSAIAIAQDASRAIKNRYFNGRVWDPGTVADFWGVEDAARRKNGPRPDALPRDFLPDASYILIPDSNAKLGRTKRHYLVSSPACPTSVWLT